MNVKDLIKLLQEKVQQHEADPEYYSMEVVQLDTLDNIRQRANPMVRLVNN